VGANLGVLSIALALANPAAVGWAYEPNPATFAYLRANIAANGLEGRLHAVNAGVTRNGRPIFMPECVIKNPGGSQMATTQWHNGRTTQSCFSQACKAKMAGIAACMRENPRMTRIPSVTLDDAFAAAGVLLNASTSSSSSDSSQGDTGTIEVGKHRHGEQLDFLKVDCEGCEHIVLDQMRSRPRIIGIEIWPNDPFGIHNIAWLETNNYRIVASSGPCGETQVWAKNLP
jgi:FkbM family methyltransferase